MKKVFYVETTTDGKTLLYCSIGENTGDVEIIELPKVIKSKDCDCKFSFELEDGFCKICEEKFYNKAFNRQINNN